MSNVKMNVDRYERVHKRALQLHAFLCLISGEGGEAFRCLADDLQSDYLWGACDMVPTSKRRSAARAATRPSRNPVRAGRLALTTRIRLFAAPSVPQREAMND
ncbi:hypothetical protein [Caballeronia mineralivorans]|jgi:hypothetical protein|uniref:hypothetical protein n=1 Tax=Caballeronia mineralivorans TaxID=2010198 RepID=UPI0023F4F351|nr:hypothetical protein [Caballeronia mineralivorans]MDB5781903.1 hypothetical protein [Caballeronia mineralivorans]MEA3101539.1 hypothetical protein [Caballeronia mineralivorans]